MSNKSNLARILMAATVSGATLGLLYVYYKSRRRDLTKTYKKLLPPPVEKKQTVNLESIVECTESFVEHRHEEQQSTKEKESVHVDVTSSDDVLPSQAQGEDALALIKDTNESVSLVDTTVSEPVPIVEQEEVNDVNNEKTEKQPVEPVEQTLSPGAAVLSTEKENASCFSFDVTQRTSQVIQKVIPKDLVAAVIGKGGSNIKQFQSRSNTNIKFLDAFDDNGDRICEIRGTLDDIFVAENLLTKFIQDQPKTYSQSLIVPEYAIGRIIGRGGETIRRMQAQSRARIVTDNKDVFNNDGVPSMKLVIKGTEQDIDMARRMIEEKVHEEETFRRLETSGSRTPRSSFSNSSASPSTSMQNHFFPSVTSMGSASAQLPSLMNSDFEVMVSCVYNPNKFWIQLCGRNECELDKLCENMTESYFNESLKDTELHTFQIGEYVAVPYYNGGGKKLYRGKVIGVDSETVEVYYVDYGDASVLKKNYVYQLKSEFAQLPCQAIEATLNITCPVNPWPGDVVGNFCDMTYCAQWTKLTCRIKNILPSESGDKLVWIELVDKDKNINIGEELIKRGAALPGPPVMTTPGETSSFRTPSTSSSASSQGSSGTRPKQQQHTPQQKQYTPPPKQSNSAGGYQDGRANNFKQKRKGQTRNQQPYSRNPNPNTGNGK